MYENNPLTCGNRRFPLAPCVCSEGLSLAQTTTHMRCTCASETCDGSGSGGSSSDGSGGDGSGSTGGTGGSGNVGSSSSVKQTGAIAGGVAGVVGLALVLFLLLRYRQRQNARANNEMRLHFANAGAQSDGTFQVDNPAFIAGAGNQVAAKPPMMPYEEMHPPGAYVGSEGAQPSFGVPTPNDVVSSGQTLA